MNPYDVLGVPVGASEAEIKARYRELARRWHPDRNGGTAEALQKFKEINGAYEMLQKGASTRSGYEEAPRSHGSRDPFGWATPDAWNEVQKHWDEQMKWWEAQMNKESREQEKVWSDINDQFARFRKKTRPCPHCGGSGKITEPA